MEEEHVASFEWSFVALTTNETINQTFPQLIVYAPNGQKFDTKVLTASFVPLVEYHDLVGWMMDTIGTNYVKWLIYSGNEFQVRISQGFGTSPLPTFTVQPISLKVSPGQTVTVQFSLPTGVQNYEASWNDPSFSTYIELISENFNSQNDQYEIKFKFLDSAVNHRFTVQVACEKYGRTYEASASILVEAQPWALIGFAVVLLGCVAGGGFFGLRRLSQTRRVPPSPETPLRTDLT